MNDAISGEVFFLERGLTALDFYIVMLSEWVSDREALLKRLEDAADGALGGLVGREHFGDPELSRLGIAAERVGDRVFGGSELGARAMGRMLSTSMDSPTNLRERLIWRWTDSSSARPRPRRAGRRPVRV